MSKSHLLFRIAPLIQLSYHVWIDLDFKLILLKRMNGEAAVDEEQALGIIMNETV